MLEPFEQLDNRYNRSRGGAGLALVRSLVFLHDGDIRIDSEVGAGTTVSVIFPADALGGWETDEEDEDPAESLPIDALAAGTAA